MKPVRSTESIIVLSFCAISMIGLFAFAAVRVMRGDIAVAIVEVIGFVASATIFAFTLWTGKVQVGGLLLATLSLAGIVGVVWRLGPADVYFLYPVILLTFLLARPRVAVPMTALALASVSFLIYSEVGWFGLLKLAVSITGCILFAWVFASQRDKERDSLIKSAVVDPLTEVGNRRALYEKLDEAIGMKTRSDTPVSMILVDLDNFKDINDTEGHLVGDEVLRQIARAVKLRIRASDSVYRYGGDEFVIVALAGDLQTAVRLAEEVRVLIPRSVDATRMPVRVSLGVAELRHGESADDCLHRADEALYEAKRGGRDTVAAAPLP